MRELPPGPSQEHCKYPQSLISPFSLWSDFAKRLWLIHHVGAVLQISRFNSVEAGP